MKCITDSCGQECVPFVPLCADCANQLPMLHKLVVKCLTPDEDREVGVMEAVESMHAGLALSKTSIRSGQVSQTETLIRLLTEYPHHFAESLRRHTHES
jgi:hypothetical protein